MSDASRVVAAARWLTVAGAGQDVQMVLQKVTDERAARIGQATTWVLETADCRKTHETLRARGVQFSEPPTKQPWGVQAVFKDLYGNTFALVESSE
jgi:predicted enzyme related to lactoylglutathione lyase